MGMGGLETEASEGRMIARAWELAIWRRTWPIHTEAASESITGEFGVPENVAQKTGCHSLVKGQSYVKLGSVYSSKSSPACRPLLSMLETLRSDDVSACRATNLALQMENSCSLLLLFLYGINRRVPLSRDMLVSIQLGMHSGRSDCLGVVKECGLVCSYIRESTILPLPRKWPFYEEPGPDGLANNTFRLIRPDGMIRGLDSRVTFLWFDGSYLLVSRTIALRHLVHQPNKLQLTTSKSIIGLPVVKHIKRLWSRQQLLLRSWFLDIINISFYSFMPEVRID